MRIQLDSAAAAADLVDYLRRCECSATFAGGRVVEAFPPRRQGSSHQAVVELEPYLRVWRVLHPEFTVRPFALAGG